MTGVIEIKDHQSFRKHIKVGDIFYFLRPDLEGIRCRILQSYTGDNKVTITSPGCSVHTIENTSLYFGNSLEVYLNEEEAKIWLDEHREARGKPPLYDFAESKEVVLV